VSHCPKRIVGLGQANPHRPNSCPGRCPNRNPVTARPCYAVFQEVSQPSSRILQSVPLSHAQGLGHRDSRAIAHIEATKPASTAFVFNR